jgi:hypothetical protein
MTKIILGKAPETFKHTVKFPMLDGTKGSIVCEFRYRTRREYGTFIDALAEENRAEVQATIEPDSTVVAPMTTAMNTSVAANARFLVAALVGWDLDVPFTEANAQLLADELPGAAQAIADAYREAIMEGRLGN